MDPIQKQLTWEVKVLDKANRIIEMIGSTEDIDRAGDSMKVDGVKLENYLKNPVILANHNYSAGEKSTVIGKALGVSIQAKQLVFKIQFAETDNAKEWFYLYSEGYMKASSIGFIPLERAPNKAGGYDFTSWELLELSLVTVPCNPNAVARAFEEGKISKGLFDQMKESGEIMDPKEVAKAIEDAIKAIQFPEQKDYSEEIKALSDLVTGLATKVADPVEPPAEPETKSGASISAGNQAKINKACDGMMEHIKNLKSMVSGDQPDPGKEPDGDEGKEYTDEQIQKAVEEKLEAIMKGAK